MLVVKQFVRDAEHIFEERATCGRSVWPAAMVTPTPISSRIPSAAMALKHPSSEAVSEPSRSERNSLKQRGTQAIHHMDLFNMLGPKREDLLRY